MHEISLVRNIFRTLEDEFPGEIEKCAVFILPLAY